MRTVGWSETAHSSSISLGISAPSSSVSGGSCGGTETSSAGCGRGMAMDASVVFVVRRGGVAARPCGGVTASCATVAPGSSTNSSVTPGSLAPGCSRSSYPAIIALYPLLVRASRAKRPGVIAWTPRRGATPNVGRKAERAAYLLQHSLCRALAAGRWEATGAVFIRDEGR